MYKVQLIPDRVEFEVESHESILDAALRAGITMEYHCSNGTCGRCGVRVLAGEVERIRYSDFVFSDAEKERNMVLPCAVTARSDLVIEAGIARSSRDIQLQTLTAKIRKREFVTDDLMVLHLKTPRTQRLRFLAGQYVTLRIEGIAPYDTALASCPCEDMRLEVHLRRSADEPFSRYLFESARVGQGVEVQGPRGDFVLHEPSDRPLLLLAFDTGFGAIKSLLEHSLALNDERLVYLYWLNCQDGKPYMHNWCRSMQDAIDNFHYRYLGMREDCPADVLDVPGSVQVIERCISSILDDIDDLSEYEAYVAAPEIIKRAARDLLGSRGLKDANILIEPVHGNKDVSCLSN